VLTHLVLVFGVVSILWLGGVLPAAAQPASRSGAVIIKAGGNVERSPSVDGESAGFGVAVSYRAASGWGIESEFWLPQFHEGWPGRKHRDILLNITAIRLFGGGPRRPFVLIGGAIGAEQFRPGRSSGLYEPYALTGAGVEIALTPRVAVVPELRLNLGVQVAIVRPAVGLKLTI
jgi:hypothetical protein